MAGDVYGAPPYTGRGGWSWYTGSAAWMHRAAIESLFGLEFGPQRLRFRPCFPPDWGRAHMHLQWSGGTLEFAFERRTGAEDISSPSSDLTHLDAGAWLEYQHLQGLHSVMVSFK